MRDRNCLCVLMEPATGEPDSRGHVPQTGKEVMKFWCKIEQLSANELLAFNQMYPTANYKLTTVYARSVTPTPAMWLDYHGRRFEIIGINNVKEQNREWEFFCTEKVPVRASDV